MVSNQNRLVPQTNEPSNRTVQKEENSTVSQKK